MKPENLLKTIGEVDEKLIAESAEYPRREGFTVANVFLRVAAAACFALVIAGSVFLMSNMQYAPSDYIEDTEETDALAEFLSGFTSVFSFGYQDESGVYVDFQGRELTEMPLVRWNGMNFIDIHGDIIRDAPFIGASNRVFINYELHDFSGGEMPEVAFLYLQFSAGLTAPMTPRHGMPTPAFFYQYIDGEFTEIFFRRERRWIDIWRNEDERLIFHSGGGERFVMELDNGVMEVVETLPHVISSFVEMRPFSTRLLEQEFYMDEVVAQKLGIPMIRRRATINPTPPTDDQATAIVYALIEPFNDLLHIFMHGLAVDDNLVVNDPTFPHLRSLQDIDDFIETVINRSPYFDMLPMFNAYPFYREVDGVLVRDLVPHWDAGIQDVRLDRSNIKITHVHEDFIVAEVGTFSGFGLTVSFIYTPQVGWGLSYFRQILSFAPAPLGELLMLIWDILDDPSHPAYRDIHDIIASATDITENAIIVREGIHIMDTWGDGFSFQIFISAGSPHGYRQSQFVSITLRQTEDGWRATERDIMPRFHPPGGIELSQEEFSAFSRLRGMMQRFQNTLIGAITLDGTTLYLDPVELVFRSDTARVAELGLTPEDFHDGIWHIVHSDNPQTMEFTGIGSQFVYISDHAWMNASRIDDLFAHLYPRAADLSTIPERDISNIGTPTAGRLLFAIHVNERGRITQITHELREPTPPPTPALQVFPQYVAPGGGIMTATQREWVTDFATAFTPPTAEEIEQLRQELEQLRQELENLRQEGENDGR